MLTYASQNKYLSSPNCGTIPKRVDRFVEGLPESLLSDTGDFDGDVGSLNGSTVQGDDRDFSIDDC